MTNCPKCRRALRTDGLVCECGHSGGGVALLLLPLIPVLFIIGICVYPLPGLLTLAGGAIIGGLLDEMKINGLMTFIVLVVPCFIIFVLGMRFELSLEAFPRYRQVRHVARLLIVGYVVHVIVFAFSGAGSFRADTPFLKRISLIHVIVVASLVTVAHVMFRKMDHKPGGTKDYLERMRIRRP